MKNHTKDRATDATAKGRSISVGTKNAAMQHGRVSRVTMTANHTGVRAVMRSVPPRRWCMERKLIRAAGRAQAASPQAAPIAKAAR